MGVLKRVNGGVGQGQWGREGQCQWALVRVNGGIEQWGLNGGIEKKSMKRALVRVNAVLKRGQGGWRRVRSDRAWVWVRQGCGCGSDRGVAAGQTGGCFTGL